MDSGFGVEIKIIININDNNKNKNRASPSDWQKEIHLFCVKSIFDDTKFLTKKSLLAKSPKSFPNSQVSAEWPRGISPYGLSQIRT
jgi:hypothetical protein